MIKRIVSLVLCLTFLISGNEVLVCNAEQPNTNIVLELPAEFQDLRALNNDTLLEYVEDAVYCELVDTLDPEEFYVEEVTTRFVSKEYLEELAFNSQKNVFFGYTLLELKQQFDGKPYVFTLGDDGQTTVIEAREITDDTYAEAVKNVAIGAGVIIVCASVALITKNPAAAATAGKTVKLIFTVSSKGAQAGSLIALQSGAIGGGMAAVVEAIHTGDWEEIKREGILGASEGFKFGAIAGTVAGVVDGIRIVGNTCYFKPGTPQAIKYPSGVEFSTVDNVKYPRFEKWAKATAKFDKPNVMDALNHTGLSGNYYWDSKLANAQCGFQTTPKGYVWHHVEDMQTMILIPQDLHSVVFGGMSHTGGASLIKAFLEIA